MKKLESKKAGKLILTIFLTSFFLLSCTKDNPTEYEGHLRESFLKNKDFATIKEDFNNLTEKEKLELWSEKLDQLLSQNIPYEHKQLIKKLKLELETPTINVKNISNISVYLAEITPEDDFNKMFATLDNYNYDNHFSGETPVNNNIKNSLKSLRFNYTKNDTNLTSKTNSAKPCNCNWTCSLYAGGSTSKCTVTASGCGFLWAFECEQRVSPMLEAFPDDETQEIEIEIEP